MKSALAITFSPGEAKGCAAFAHALGASFNLVCFGEASSNAWGAETAFVIKADPLDPVSLIANSILPIARNYDCIYAASSIAGKDLIARLAGQLDVDAVTDVQEILPDQTMNRPIMAGGIVATVQSEGRPLLATFRPSGFDFQPAESAPKVVTELPFLADPNVTVVSNRTGAAKRPDLTQAKVVVSGGKPLRDASTFESIIGGLADALGGAVGATRAAVDLGIAANDLQVGQTGKVVAPQLYIAAGISGSTQHVAGIKDSKIIVAINKDPDATIFEVADIGIVADLFEVVPELTQRLKR